MSFSLYVMSIDHIISLVLEAADSMQQQLHQENVNLKRALKESVPGRNPRAEAAERRLFEMRKTIVSLAVQAFPSELGSHLRIELPLKGIRDLWESWIGVTSPH